ncbi:HTH-type transcriptional regulator GltR (plasmid) [Variovorax sp. WDL1]|nr:HTH-type transcriptional regulator GltR [Variovorax sp. B2]PNG46308.1 HTH-type transcriptional regulator GltR [Variovorax sp. B4]VTV19124.1 HTH-type transcriptional regulator GltR [Variovorax sp. WDL1]
MSLMTLKHLEALYWISRLASFTAAAEHLHSTQSAISMRIRDLESALGQELIDRTARSVKLTPKGRELVGYTEQILTLITEIKTRVADPMIVTGELRIGITEYVALTWLPNLVRALNAQFPRVTLELKVDLTVSLLEQLRQGQIDVALLPGPITQSELDNVALGPVEFGWMASPALNVPRTALSPRDLDAWPILSMAKASSIHPTLQRWFENSTAVGRGLNISNSLSVLASWTLAGLGVSYLPVDYCKSDIGAGRLQHLDVTPRLPPIEYYAVFQHQGDQWLAQAVAELAVKVSRFGTPRDETAVNDDLTMTRPGEAAP